jgi:hypothetical protein
MERAGQQAGEEEVKITRHKVLLMMAAIAVAWVAVGTIRAKIIEVRLNRNLAHASPDAFGGANRDGNAVIEVELWPFLINPFRSNVNGTLKVNGEVRDLIQSR